MVPPLISTAPVPRCGAIAELKYAPMEICRARVIVGHTQVSVPVPFLVRVVLPLILSLRLCWR